MKQSSSNKLGLTVVSCPDLFVRIHLLTVHAKTYERMLHHWADRLRPPKCDKKEDPQVWATSFPHQFTLTQKEKS